MGRLGSLASPVPSRQHHDQREQDGSSDVRRWVLGSPITLTYKGALGTDGHIAGAVTVEELNVTGEFTATPAAK